MYFFLYVQDAPHQDITERTVPYVVQKTVRKVTVTLCMERVLAVKLDIVELIVVSVHVSAYTYI